MIRMFVIDKPLGLSMTGVIPSAVPPQAVLDDLERHHHHRRLLPEGNSSIISWAGRGDKEQLLHYCHGVMTSLRGSVTTAPFHCKLRLLFELDVKYLVLTPSSTLLEEEFRRSSAVLLKLDMCRALELYASCECSHLMEVGVESMRPIVDEIDLMSKERYYLRSLAIEIALNGVWEQVSKVATILSSPTFDASIFFDSGILLSGGRITKFELVSAANNPMELYHEK